MRRKLLFEMSQPFPGSACAGKSEIGGENPPISEDIRYQAFR